jgi:hypothetical protein
MSQVIGLACCIHSKGLTPSTPQKEDVVRKLVMMSQIHLPIKGLQFLLQSDKEYGILFFQSSRVSQSAYPV